MQIPFKPPATTASAEQLQIQIDVGKMVEKWKAYMITEKLERCEFRARIPSADVGSYIYACLRAKAEEHRFVIENLCVYPVGVEQGVIMREFCFYVKLEPAARILHA